MTPEQTANIIKYIVSANYNLIKLENGLSKVKIVSADGPLDLAESALSGCVLDMLGVDDKDLQTEKKVLDIMANRKLTEKQMFDEIMAMIPKE